MTHGVKIGQVKSNEPYQADAIADIPALTIGTGGQKASQADTQAAIDQIIATLNALMAGLREIKHLEE